MKGRKRTLSQHSYQLLLITIFFHSNEEKVPVLDGSVSDLMLTELTSSGICSSSALHLLEAACCVLCTLPSYALCAKRT